MTIMQHIKAVEIKSEGDETGNTVTYHPSTHTRICFLFLGFGSSSSLVAIPAFLPQGQMGVTEQPTL